MFMRSLKRMQAVIFVFALLAAAPAYARLSPATEAAAPIPDVQVADSAGHPVSIRAVLEAMGTGPVIILPIYTRCGASCPLQTQKIKRLWNSLNRGTSLRVLVFSFDPKETAASISDYRKREGVPENWVVLHAPESSTRSFFDFFHYSVIDENGQLIHPDRIFLLDSSLAWRFTMEGLNYNPEEIVKVVDQLQSPGLAVWIETHPDAVAWTGFLCILVSLSLLAVWRVGRKPSNHTSAIKNQA